MITETRTKNSLRNILFAFIYYIIQLTLTLLVRVFFVRTFVVEYLGVNTLFANIISILSVVESGFGSAMIFALYEPVANNDEEKVRQLIMLYKKCYSIIGVIIFLIGVCLIPFLPYLIKNFEAIDLNLYLVFGIFLVTSLLSYFTAHRRSLFYATQRNDIENKINIVGYFVTAAVQLIAIFVFKNYYVYALAGLINTIVVNTLIIFITNKKYRNYLQSPQSSLDKTSKKTIKKNIFALFYHKIGGIVLTGTDSIVMSTFIGITILGKYSNYLLITTYLTNILMMFVNSMKGSVGNSISTESVEQNIKTFKKLNFAYIFITSFCVICFISLANPFVKIFFGSNLTLSFATTIVIGINLYLYHIRQVVYIFKDCKGLFAENKFAPLIEALINLIVSLILVHYLGIIGVILGTIISNILVPLWNEPYILTKYYMKKSTIKYLGRILLYTTSTLISGVVTVFVCSFIPDGSIWYLILKFVVCGVVAGVSLIVTMLPFKEFKECVSWGKSIFSNFRRKDKKNSNIEINNK